MAGIDSVAWKNADRFVRARVRQAYATMYDLTGDQEAADMAAEVAWNNLREMSE